MWRGRPRPRNLPLSVAQKLRQRRRRDAINAPRLIRLIPPLSRSAKCRPRLDRGEAQIRATVTAKSRRGQVRKHYIWYGLSAEPRQIAHTMQHVLKNWVVRKGGGRDRESEVSLTQAAAKDNAASEARGQACNFERSRPEPLRSKQKREALDLGNKQAQNPPCVY